jgi:hypothetical protein
MSDSGGSKKVATHELNPFPKYGVKQTPLRNEPSPDFGPEIFGNAQNGGRFPGPGTPGKFWGPDLEPIGTELGLQGKRNGQAFAPPHVARSDSGHRGWGDFLKRAARGRGGKPVA